MYNIILFVLLLCVFFLLCIDFGVTLILLYDRVRAFKESVSRNLRPPPPNNNIPPLRYDRMNVQSVCDCAHLFPTVYPRA